MDPLFRKDFELIQEAILKETGKVLPKTDRKDVEILWHLKYYDGPLSGVCRNKITGKVHYFNSVTDGYWDSVEGQDLQDVLNYYNCKDEEELNKALEDKSIYEFPYTVYIPQNCKVLDYSKVHRNPEVIFCYSRAYILTPLTFIDRLKLYISAGLFYTFISTSIFHKNRYKDGKPNWKQRSDRLWKIYRNPIMTFILNKFLNHVADPKTATSYFI